MKIYVGSADGGCVFSRNLYHRCSVFSKSSNIWDRYWHKKNDKFPKIKSGLQSGNKCYYGLSNLLNARMISKNLKIKLYRTLIHPVVMYSCDVWTLRKSDQNRLLIFEKKIFRRIFGPCISETMGEWRTRKNEELKQLNQMPGIIRDI